MAKKIRIKDIAKMAGISPGTVDRVLHNRGNVSPSARQAIDAVLKEVNYQPNIHLSSISLRRSYKLVVTVPEFETGEYWASFHKGVKRAMSVFEHINIDCKFMYYNQFDLYSCRSVFKQIPEMAVDGVIIGPTFRDETIFLTNILEEKNIPYIYVDSQIEYTFPMACFAANLYQCGYLMGKLINMITPEDSHFVLFQTERVGDASANTTILRKQGLMTYLQEVNLHTNLHRLSFSVGDSERNEELIGNYFEEHPEVRGALVLNSRASVIANYFERHNINGVKLIGIDLTDSNIQALKAGRIDFLMGQRPEQQGYLGVKTLIQALIYGTKDQTGYIMPLDIVMRENVDLYQEFSDISFVDGK